MQITFACTQCQTHLEIDATAAGSEIRCPKCQATLTVPRKGPGPGTTVGGFRITKLLGKGGMGEVYLASQLSLDRDVALKILPRAIVADKENVDRFLNEVRVLAKLEHPNIVTAYEAGVDSGIHYLAMGYVRGDTLEQHLKTKGVMAEAEALRMIAKLAGAMGYAWHRYKLIHRDIKPANVILDETGEPKLADLGLTKSLADTGGMTLSGTVMGTPCYMSPEQVESKADLDFRSDIYSLGATLYHMVTGHIPFEATSLMESLRKQATERLPDPRTCVPALSDGCVRLLAAMMAKVPEDRPQSWEAVTEDIELTLAGKGGTLRPLAEGKSVVQMLSTGQIKSQAAGRPPHAGRPPVGGKVPGTGQKPGAGAIMKDVPPQKTPAQVRLEQERKSRSVATGVTLTLVVAAVAGVWIMQRGAKPAPGVARSPVARKPLAVAVIPVAGVTNRSAQQVVPATRAAPNVPPNGGVRAVETPRMQGEAPTKPRTAERQSEWGAVAAATPPTHEPAQGTESRKQQVVAASGVERPPHARQPDTKVKADAEWKAAEALDGLADELLRQDWEAVRLRIAETDRDARAKDREDWVAIKTSACAVARMPEVILNSFEQDKGKKVTVTLKTGTESLSINKAEGGKVKAEKLFEVDGKIVGQSEREFGLSDLTLKERLLRLGVDKAAERQIMRGLLAWEAGKSDAAVRLFRESGCSLGLLLVGRIDELQAERTKMAEAAARTAREQLAGKSYAAILQGGALSAQGDDRDALMAEIRKKRFAEGDVYKMKKALAAFSKEHGDTEVAARVKPVLDVLGQIRPNVPLYVDKADVEAAMEALKKANPQEIFDRTPRYVEDGIVLDLGRMKGLHDITPLAGLPIVELNISGSLVSDLRILVGMPLRVLRISGTKVDDLRHLAGMQLTELEINSTLVADLRPLRGMPLQVLHLAWSRVTDLSPLRGMPLTKVDLTWTGVEDVSPLAGMPLTILRLGGTRVRDLRPVKDIPGLVLER